jgi:hypothetical protein
MNMSKAIAAILIAMLFAMAGEARAQPTVGQQCVGTGCRAEDGKTVGGSCYGHRCIAGNAGTIGGSCVGDYCQAGGASNVSGDCLGDFCKAGQAGLGGNCFGKGCQATGGGDCFGEGCTSGPEGRAHPGATPPSVGCCLAWLGVANSRRLPSPELLAEPRPEPHPDTRVTGNVSSAGGIAKCLSSLRNVPAGEARCEVQTIQIQLQSFPPFVETPPK